MKHNFLTIVKFIGYNRTNVEFLLSEEPLMRHGIEQRLHEVCETAVLIKSEHYEIKKLNETTYREQVISPFISEQVYQYWLLHGNVGNKDNNVLSIYEMFPLLKKEQIEFIIDQEIHKQRPRK